MDNSKFLNVLGTIIGCAFTTPDAFNSIINNPMGEFHTDNTPSDGCCQSKHTNQKEKSKMFTVTFNIDGRINTETIMAKNAKEAKNLFNSQMYRNADGYGDWASLEIIYISEIRRETK